jgi:hypothetical protein
MKRPALLAAVFLMSMAGASEAASTWYVKADAAAGGNGSRSRLSAHCSRCPPLRLNGGRLTTCRSSCRSQSASNRTVQSMPIHTREG